MAPAAGGTVRWLPGRVAGLAIGTAGAGAAPLRSTALCAAAILALLAEPPTDVSCTLTSLPAVSFGRVRGGAGFAAQASSAPGHAWAAIARRLGLGSRKLPTAPRIGPRVLVEALGGALRPVERGSVERSARSSSCCSRLRVPCARASHHRLKNGTAGESVYTLLAAQPTRSSGV